MSVLLIGDSHLERCHLAAQFAAPNADFGQDSLKVTWHFQKNQVKLASKFYKENISCKEAPDVVVIMCGGYDIVNGRTSVEIVNTLKGFVSYLNGTPVKYIIVCSIIEIKRPTNAETNATNKIVKNTNKSLAKDFKNMSKVIFINVRPPGNIHNIIIKDPHNLDDRYHLKRQGYNHVYKRLLTTLKERVIPNLPNVSKNEVKMKSNNSGDNDDIDSNYKKFQYCNIESRMTEFKQIIFQDYKKVCVMESDLTEKFNKIEQQLKDILKEKNEIISVYKKLFGVDIKEENAQKDNCQME